VVCSPALLARQIHGGAADRKLADGPGGTVPTVRYAWYRLDVLSCRLPGG